MSDPAPTLVVPPLIMSTDPEITEQALLEIAIATVTGATQDAEGLTMLTSDLDWIVEDMIPRGVLLFFAGPPKISKSFLCIELCNRVSRGQPFLGHRTAKSKTWYINLEDGKERIARRLHMLGIRPTGDADWNPRDFLVTWSRDVLQHVITILELSPTVPDLVVLDPMIWVEILLGVQNENDAQEVTALLTRLQNIAQKQRISLLITHHYSKAGDKVRGSSAFEAAADGWWTLSECEDDVRLLSWTLRDGRMGKVAYDMQFSEDGTKATVRVQDAATATPKANGNGGRPRSDDALCRAKILAVLPTDDAISQNKISAASGVRKARLGPLLLAMEDEGLVTTGPGGKGWTRVEQPKVGSLVCVTEDTEARD